jgi:sugar lactone lactonase YvrE
VPVAAGPPTAVARARDGSLWCIASGRVCHVTSTGAELPLAGDLKGAASDALALALDREDRLYVLDRAGEVVRRYQTDGRCDGEVAAIAPASAPPPPAD